MFMKSLKQKAPKLTDFAKGTTTLAFEFKEGVLVAVDARATMGAFISSNKYSEQLKTIIFSVVPKDEREWKKTTFQWHIFKKAGVRQN